MPPVFNDKQHSDRFFKSSDFNISDLIKNNQGCWKKHFLFGKESSVSGKRLGSKSIDILLINTVVPFLFAYFKKKNSDNDIALKLLELIPAEKNVIIRKWMEHGIGAFSAFDSQALLQLKKKYCDEKKCLRCRIGHKVLSCPQKL